MNKGGSDDQIEGRDEVRGPTKTLHGTRTNGRIHIHKKGRVEQEARSEGVSTGVRG